MLKEAISLSALGFEIIVIWSPITPWADDFDFDKFKLYSSIKWIQAGYHFKRDKFKYIASRIRKKIWIFIYAIIGNKFDAGIKSIALFSQELSIIALQHKADVYIGHNLGAISSIVKAAYKFKAETIFDFEDFYRGEFDEDSKDAQVIRDIENKYIPKVNNFTAASPEIANAYNSIFPNIIIQTILNVFPIAYAQVNLVNLSPIPLKLFWFSQFVGKNRGLETVISAIGNLRNHYITLTLLGNVTLELKDYFINLFEECQINSNRLSFLNPVKEIELVQIASEHHIGIASEVGYNLNRQYCLTNKLFIYMLSGNAILCTDTLAQTNFVNEIGKIGKVYPEFDYKVLSIILENYINNPELLSRHRINSLNCSYKVYHWEYHFKSHPIYKMLIC